MRGATMYEDLSPSSHACGLYDELAYDLGSYLRGLSICSADSAMCALALELVQLVVVALRHDNATFNEARFRLRINALAHSQ